MATTARMTGEDDNDSTDDNSKDDGNDCKDDNNDGSNGDSGGGGGGKIGGEVGGVVTRSVAWLVSVFFAIGCLARTYHRNRTDKFWNKSIVVKICLNSIRHVQTCRLEFILFVPIGWLPKFG
jgi:hypothetical protein